MRPRKGKAPEEEASPEPGIEAAGAGDPLEATGESEQAPRAELQALERERDEWKDRMLRKAAELENFRKRTERERESLRESGTAELAERMLDILDNLERALEAVPESERESGLARGVSLVREQFLDALRSFRIEPLDPVGKPFDPHLHEALLEEEREDVEPGTVLEELGRGYRHGDRLLRASRVAVSRGPARPEEAPPVAPDRHGDEHADL